MTQTKQAVKPAPDWISALKLSAPAPALELQLNVRISADLDARLERLAGARKITQAALVRMLLQAGAHALEQTPAAWRAIGGE